MFSEKKFNQEFLRSSDMIYNLGIRLFGRLSDEASDFVQDVYLHAIERRHSFSRRSKFSTWLYRLALNYGLNVLKKKKDIFVNDSYLDKSLLSIPDMTTSDLPKKVIAKETQKIIHKELNTLPKAYRICLILYYFEELRYSEIAKKLDLKEGTVKSNIHRGKEILRRSLLDLR